MTIVPLQPPSPQLLLLNSYPLLLPLIIIHALQPITPLQLLLQLQPRLLGLSQCTHHIPNRSHQNTSSSPVARISAASPHVSQPCVAQSRSAGVSQTRRRRVLADVMLPATPGINTAFLYCRARTCRFSSSLMRSDSCSRVDSRIAWGDANTMRNCNTRAAGGEDGLGSMQASTVGSKHVRHHWHGHVPLVSHLSLALLF